MAALQKGRVPTAITVCAYVALVVLSVVLAVSTSYGY